MDEISFEFERWDGHGYVDVLTYIGVQKIFIFDQLTGNDIPFEALCGRDQFFIKEMVNDWRNHLKTLAERPEDETHSASYIDWVNKGSK